MKKIKLSLFLDYFLVTLIIFFISFVWCRYIFKNLILSIATSIILSLLIVTIFVKVKNRREIRKKRKKDITSHIEECANALLFNSFEENAYFYKNILDKKYKIEIKPSFLYLENSLNRVALFLLFDVKKINQDQVIFCLKSVKKYDLTKIVIICNSYDNNVLNITKNYNIKTIILNKQQNYNEILSVYNAFPQTDTKLKLDEKLTFSVIINNAINKKKFKTYFMGGIFLFIASLFIQYNIYYIIFSSVMFLLSILCLFSNKIFKRTKTEIF